MSTKQDNIRKQVIEMYEKWKLHSKSMMCLILLLKDKNETLSVGLLKGMRKQGHG